MSFESLTKDEALESLVKKFYQKVLIDPLLIPFFTGHDIDKLMQHQVRFLSHLLYDNAETQLSSLHSAHLPLVEKLNLDDSHFNRVLTHLISSLKSLKAPDETIAVVMSAVETTRHAILNK